MVIRKATMDDCVPLRVLYLGLEKDAVRFQPEHFVIGERDDAFFRCIFDSENQDILVAQLDDAVVGFAHVILLKQKNIACLKPQTALYIQDMAVSPDMRSVGIGSRLMEACKAYGAEHGADFVRTEVFPQNANGLRFYEKNGFCEMMKTLEFQINE